MSAAIALAAATVLGGGCAAMPKVAATRPPELQSLAELPPLALPDAATQPSNPAPTEALRLYAKGRDALIQNKKKDAQVALEAALQLDPSSAVAHHDLGYAWLGFEASKAAAEFRLAIKYDPLDADSRVQLARLLVTKKAYMVAVEQLRLARLSPDATDDDSLGAMIDLLLGRLLQPTHPAAALECFEHVIALLDNGQIQLRGRPELAELIRQPAVLMIQSGDLALETRQFDKAAALYERVKRENPQAASMLEMRIAAAELAAGHAAAAAVRGLGIVEAQHASFSSVAAFVELFHNDPAAARKALDSVPQSADDDVSSRHVLRSILLRCEGNAAAAVNEIDLADRFELPAVRQTVAAYQAAGREQSLFLRLLEQTTAQPKSWNAIQRGWIVLSQNAKPEPLIATALMAINVPDRLEPARLVAAALLRQEQGEPVIARQLTEAAAKKNAAFVAAIQAAGSDIASLLPGDAADDPTALADLLADESNDPVLLTTLVGKLLQQGQKTLVQEALHTASARQPLNVVVAGTYAQVLSADEQRTEAIAVLEHATAAPSANELYYLSSQYSGLNDNAGAEKVLRKALALDASNASVCNDLGYLLTDSGRELDFAESLLQRAVGIEPQNPAFLDSLGWLLYKRSRFDGASHYLTEAVAASDPADPLVLDHAGDSYFRNNEVDRAAKAWNDAIAAIRQRGTSDPQLRLRIERKLRQAAAKQAVDLAPLAIKN